MKIVFLGMSLILFSSLFAQIEIPTWFRGDWSGTVTQNFPSGAEEEYRVLIEHKSDYFSITSESFYYKCIGRWVIESADDMEIIFIQDITAESKDKLCVTDAKIKIQAKDGVVYYFTKGEVFGECKGVITQNKKTTAEF